MSNETRVNGVVKWFNSDRGYGFLLKDEDDQTEYFCHYSYIDMDGYKTLKNGQEVVFDIIETDKGIQAQNVKPVE